MATVPVVPTFTAGTVVTAAALNQLGAAVQFLLTPPKAVLQQTNVAPVSGGQAIAATTATAIIWTVAVNNGDSAWSAGSPTRYTSQTPGYYLFEGVWQSTAELTSGYRGAFFRITTGANNPGGAGLTTSFGASREANVTSATGINYTAVGAALISPYLYVLDYVELIAYSGAAETTGFTDGGSYLSATLVSLLWPSPMRNSPSCRRKCRRSRGRSRRCSSGARACRTS